MPLLMHVIIASTFINFYDIQILHVDVQLISLSLRTGFSAVVKVILRALLLLLFLFLEFFFFRRWLRYAFDFTPRDKLFFRRLFFSFHLVFWPILGLVVPFYFDFQFPITIIFLF
jgi:hypothetical protein